MIDHHGAHRHSFRAAAGHQRRRIRTAGTADHDDVETRDRRAPPPHGEPNPLQPHTVRALKVPDYFAAFKERMDLAGYLGATIYAKLVFGDLSGRNYITKKQYSDGGPSVAFAIGSV